jgi:glycosyltransferase involved in cell wall biosynthesis
MGQPLVTVLINNYNYAPFLREAIDSSLNQTYRPIEIIVVDDGSTDNSRAIISSYDKKLTAILKENGGQASAFNAGIAAGNGDLYFFLDSDDFFYPEKISKIANVFAALDNSKPLLVHHRLEIRQEDGRPQKEVLFGKVHRNPLNLAEYARKYKYPHYEASATSGIAINRRMAELLFPLPERNVTTSADEFVVRGASLVGELHSTEDVVGAYRVHGNNHWYSGTRRMSTEYLKALDAYLNQKLAENNLPGRISYSESMLRWWDLVRDEKWVELAWRMIKVNTAQRDRHTLRFTYGMCEFAVMHLWQKVLQLMRARLARK